MEVRTGAANGHGFSRLYMLLKKSGVSHHHNPGTFSVLCPDCLFGNNKLVRQPPAVYVCMGLRVKGLNWGFGFNWGVGMLRVAQIQILGLDLCSPKGQGATRELQLHLIAPINK